MIQVIPVYGLSLAAIDDASFSHSDNPKFLWKGLWVKHLVVNNLTCLDQFMLKVDSLTHTPFLVHLYIPED